ncbi:MAG: hypothetical protein ACRDNG_03695 [Gaiellaceae bacterium]
MSETDHAELVAREYADIERLVERRLDRTAWLRGEEEPWVLALRAVAEVRPRRVLEAATRSRWASEHRDRPAMSYASDLTRGSEAVAHFRLPGQWKLFASYSPVST